MDKLLKLFIRVFFNDEYKKMKQSEENEFFSTIVNKTISDYVSRKIDSRQFLIFRNESEVRNWCAKRDTFWNELIDINKNESLSSYNNCKSEDAKNIVRSTRFYRGNIAFHINNLLRFKRNEFEYFDESESENTLQHIINLDNLFSNWSLNQNIISYRWVTTDGFEELIDMSFDDIATGVNFFDWGFASSSLNMEYQMYDSHSDFNDSYVVMILKVRSNVEAVDTCTISCVTNEAELTINRKTRMTITEIIYKKNRNAILVVDLCN